MYLTIQEKTFPAVWNKDRHVLANLLVSKLERIALWLTKSGMKVNELKTSLCLFHNSDVRPITIVFNGGEIKSKKNINVLGVIFDQKMQWSDHIAYTVLKSNKAFNAVRLLKRHFKFLIPKNF